MEDYEYSIQMEYYNYTQYSNGILEIFSILKWNISNILNIQIKHYEYSQYFNRIFPDIGLL